MFVGGLAVTAAVLRGLLTVTVVTVLLLVPSVPALLLKGVHVPTLNLRGNSALLSCDFDSEGEQIYSVKWYKGGREIFRYLPSAAEPLTTYHRPGVHIDQDKSNSSVVTLSNLTLRSTGRYRCEVSTEAPMFSTKSGFGDLLVLVLPSSPPVIQGGKGSYSPGDLVQLNCTSSPSKPVADLAWFINDSPADPSQVTTHLVRSSRHSGLHTARSTLRQTITSADYNDKGEISISCSASIKIINWRDKTISKIRP